MIPKIHGDTFFDFKFHIINLEKPMKKGKTKGKNYECSCKNGFIGNGYSCKPEGNNPCEYGTHDCSDYGFCVYEGYSADLIDRKVTNIFNSIDYIYFAYLLSIFLRCKLRVLSMIFYSC